MSTLALNSIRGLITTVQLPLLLIYSDALHDETQFEYVTPIAANICLLSGLSTTGDVDRNKVYLGPHRAWWWLFSLKVLLSQR